MSCTPSSLSLTDCHPHPLTPNKNKKGQCALCKKKLKGASGKGKARELEGGFKCDSCNDYMLCYHCRQAHPTNRTDEFVVDVLIKVS